MSKVVGIGNALVDIIICLKDDSVLEKFQFPRGSMQLVDKNTSTRVLEATGDLKRQQASGGSCANCIHGIAKLGIPTGFIGMVGNDNFGNFFQDDMQKSGIAAKLIRSNTETGKAAVLVSANSERTFATYLGAAIELSASHIKPELFEGYDVFHIEGYLVQNHDLIRTAIEVAKQKGLKVSLDLASFNIVEENLDFLKDVIKKHVDILFANEEEARSFTGFSKPEEALEEMAKDVEIAIVKVGKNGSFIKKAGKTYKIGIIDANCIDTTGAGDLYASGFLYGLMKGLPLDKCGQIGAILSGKVIEIIGAKMDETRWATIKKMVADVENK